MRIVIDLQGAQSSGSRNRGIGRYSLSLVQGIVRNRGRHEIIIALSSLFPETIQPLREAFLGELPAKNIRVWGAEGPVAETDDKNEGRRKQAEAIREGFFGSLKPDIVLVTSLFEGFSDDAVTSVATLTNCPTAVILYDLIPLLNRDLYLSTPLISHWYDEKLEYLRRADLLLSISASSGQEAVEWLRFESDHVVNISTACSTHFHPMRLSSEDRQALFRRYGLIRPFVMYTGGIDYRKNIEGLIRAFALIPEDVRSSYQLAVVCSVQPADRERLERLAHKTGLHADELVMTGFVPEEDLVALYNACALFVFPSWHEGFGLPALEAMQCGKAVIAANTSSLPEVIGLDDALFDPHDDSAIANKLIQVLTDTAFRHDLEKHGVEQAKKFSWDITAQRALSAMEKVLERRVKSLDVLTTKLERPRMAYVSPLPPERSGISNYSAELLRVLTEWYEVDVVVDQGEVSDDWIPTHCHVRDVRWLWDHYWSYDRVIYHFGNSHFHQHMFDLLEYCPGVVVLHDFFLSGIQAYREFQGGEPYAWTKALWHSHGYQVVQQRYMVKDYNKVIVSYPANLSVLQQALGVISHSDYSRELARTWFGDEGEKEWAVIPLLRTPAGKVDRGNARAAIGLSDDAVLICSFGLLDPTKLNHRLLTGFLESSLAKDPRVHLVFVGENSPSEYGQKLLSTIRRSGLSDRIRITGWTEPDIYRAYLGAADIGVQLRTKSRGETSAAVLDCMNYGLATVVNAHGSQANLDSTAVMMLPDEFDDQEIATVLEKLTYDHELRYQLGERARDVLSNEHAPEACAAEYVRAIENIYRLDSNGLGGVVRAIAGGLSRAADKMQLASTLSENFPPAPRKMQLLVDLSTLVHGDAQSGIQRVVRSILRDWLLNPPPGWSVEPVYANTDVPGYRYARRFTSQFLAMDEAWAEDELVDAWQGDVFVGLDLQPYVVQARVSELSSWRNRGVAVYFVVYDLLPLLLPNMFNQEMQNAHRHWLQTIRQFDGAFCISRSVADELRQWFTDEGLDVGPTYKIDWFHLGADIAQSTPSKETPRDAELILRRLKATMSFLMVGTLEPRKGHAQTVAGFEALWSDGEDINLVLVGNQGWLVDELVTKLRSHPEAGHRLFWLEGISDEFLEQVYAVSSCLIAASEGEGFGLPLIEAAQHHLPIIARDIPVFREVAGEHAFYFQGVEGRDVTRAVREWLSLFVNQRHPVTEGMIWLNWHQSAQKLLTQVVEAVT